MQPRTLADVERDLRVALDVGNPERIGPLAREVDQREQAAVAVPLVNAALWYAEQGLGVFPLRPGSKIPLPGSRGCKDATTDRARILAWWERTPEANIGLATGGLVDVVDIDGAEGQATRASEEHYEKFEALTVLGTVLTPRAGGMHLYVPATARGNKAGLLPGIDYRSTGGYVVAPPSRTEIGTYRWLRPLDLPEADA